MSAAQMRLENDFKAQDGASDITTIREDDPFKWRVEFEGPPDSPYQGCTYKTILTFPKDYPFSPPSMRFLTEMWHPNIYPDGNVNISTLHPPGDDRFNEQESADETWRPVFDVHTIVRSVMSLLVDPNINSAANVDAAVQMKNDPEGWRKRVCQLARKSTEDLQTLEQLREREQALVAQSHASNAISSALAQDDAGATDGDSTESRSAVFHRWQTVDTILFDESQRDTNLLYFHQFAEFEPLVLEDFGPKIRQLAEAMLGKVILRRWRHAPAEVVVTKQMETGKVMGSRALLGRDYDAFQRGRDVAPMEDAVNEIGVFRYLENQSSHCEHVLRSFGCFQNSSLTYLTLDYMNRGELFAIIADPRNQMPGRDVLRLMHQGAQAINYLHQRNVGHRDISLENMLLKGDDARQLVVMDFGQACLLHDNCGKPFCYFRIPGKQYYRGPETYVPHDCVRAKCPPHYIDNSVVSVSTTHGYYCQVVFREPVRGSLCTAEPYGYWAAPLDMFALGVCMFISHAKKPPWRHALHEDRYFSYIQRHGVQRILQDWHVTPSMEPRALELMTDLMQVEPRRRPTIEQCLASFEGIEAATQVPPSVAPTHGYPGGS